MAFGTFRHPGRSAADLDHGPRDPDARLALTNSSVSCRMRGHFVSRFDNATRASRRTSTSPERRYQRAARGRRMIGFIHAVGHGERRRRTDEPAGCHERASSWRVDERDDRSDGRDRASEPCALVDVDQVHHGAPGVGGSTDTACAFLFVPSPRDRDEAIERAVTASRDRMPGFGLTRRHSASARYMPDGPGFAVG